MSRRSPKSTIERQGLKDTLAITASAATTGEWDFSDASGGMIYVPTGSGITSLTFHVSHDGETYVPASDSTKATPVAVVVSGISAPAAIPVPGELFGAAWIRMVGNTTGSVHVTKKG